MVNLQDLARYEFGGLAGRLLEENPEYANSALMLLNEGLSDDPYTAKLLDEEVYSNPKGIEKAVEIYSGAYQEKLLSLTIGDLSAYYDPFIDLASDEDADTIRAELDRFSGEDYASINKKLAQANYVLEGVKKGFETDSEKRKSAEDTMRKYSSLAILISTLNDSKMESLRPKVVEKHNSRNLEAIARNLRGQE